MPVPDFTVDLGNGTYLDSSGALKSSPDAGKSSFKLPASLPIPGPELQTVTVPRRPAPVNKHFGQVALKLRLNGERFTRSRYILVLLVLRQRTSKAFL